MSSTVPYSEKAEEAVIAAMLQDGAWRARASEQLSTDDFFTARHRWAFEAIKKLGDDANAVTFGQKFLDEKKYEAFGTIFAAGLAGIYINGPSFESSLKLLKEKASMRLALKIGQQIVVAAQSSSDSEKIREVVGQGLTEISKCVVTSRRKETIEVISKDFLDSWEAANSGKKPPGVETRWKSFNDRMGGIQPSYYVIAGTTGAGKTTLVLNLVDDVLKSGKRVLIYSYEMPAKDILGRLICMRSKICSDKIFNPFYHRCTAQEALDIRASVRHYEKQDGLMISSDPLKSVEQIQFEVRRAQHEGDVGLVIVDYAQLVPVDSINQDSIREQVVARVSSTLRAIALEMNVAVMCLSQLNDDGRMRESRSLENDAVVILKVQDDGIFVQKNRNGESHKTLPISLNKQIFRFVEEEEDSSDDTVIIMPPSSTRRIADPF